MGAVYPGAVRAFTQKKDQVTTVDASDVNDLQDEVAALERTIGVNPLAYSAPGRPTVSYTSLAARANSHETALATLQGQLNTLSFGATNGWSTPVLSLSQSGVTPGLLTQSNQTNYTPVLWATAPAQDPGGMWARGTSLTCVLGGWYTVVLNFAAPIDTAALQNVQNANNASGATPIPIAHQYVIAQFLINGTARRIGPSIQPWQNVYYPVNHFMHLAWHGVLHHGDILQMRVGQVNANTSGTAELSATYVRAMPGVS